MQRPIKFRAQDKTGNWWYFLLKALTDGIPPSSGLEHWCQFSGLLDKNGKEIYEGDLVKCFTSYGKEEVYDHPQEVTLPEWYKLIWSEEYDGKTRVEKVGNRFENPELLAH